MGTLVHSLLVEGTSKVYPNILILLCACTNNILTLIIVTTLTVVTTVTLVNTITLVNIVTLGIHVVNNYKYRYKHSQNTA